MGRQRNREAATGRASTFASLRIRNYRLYFFGQSISVAGTWMQNAALAWLVLQLSDGVVVGVSVALRYLPLLVFGLWGGLLADRLDKRVWMIGTETGTALISAGLALVVGLHVGSVIVILFFSLALGSVDAVGKPARQAFINELVPVELLGNAVSLNSTSTNAARVIGPALSGVMIATVGEFVCFAVNAASSAAVIASLVLLDRTALRPSRAKERAPGQLREVVGYVARTRGLAVPLIMVAVTGAFAWEYQVTLPLVATDGFGGGSWTYSILWSSLGLGAVVGGLAAARRNVVTPRALWMSAIGWGTTMLLAAVAPLVAIEVVALMMIGYGAVSFNSMSKTWLQLSVVPAMRGRVMSLWIIAWQGTTVIGGTFVGWIGEVAGSRWALVAGGIPTIAVGLYAARALGSVRHRVDADAQNEPDAIDAE